MNMYRVIRKAKNNKPVDEMTVSAESPFEAEARAAPVLGQAEGETLVVLNSQGKQVFKHKFNVRRKGHAQA